MMDKRDLKVELLRFEGKTTQSLYHVEMMPMDRRFILVLPHRAVEQEVCSDTGSTVPHLVRGENFDEAARSQQLLSEATRHLI